jgi:hypothetical protein
MASRSHTEENFMAGGKPVQVTKSKLTRKDIADVMLRLS